jgi:hypothetical protein
MSAVVNWAPISVSVSSPAVVGVHDLDEACQAADRGVGQRPGNRRDRNVFRDDFNRFPAGE